MGVSWFYNCPTSEGASESAQSSPRKSSSPSGSSTRLPALNMNNNIARKAYYETVDIIDIEDEDHSFAAFFIGMKTGPSPYVKRPLVFIIAQPSSDHCSR